MQVSGTHWIGTPGPSRSAGPGLALSRLARACGYACVAIGSAQLILGSAVEPGFDRTSASVDSQVRFLGPVFAGYGLAWIAAGSGPEPNVRQIRILSGIMAIGGLGRLLSRTRFGRPHAFQDMLTVVELAFPATINTIAGWAITRSDADRG